MADLWLILLFVTCAHSKDIHYYVDPNGSDSNTGLDVHSPYKTIAHAVNEAARATHAGANLYIELLPGYHDLQSTVNVPHHHGNLLTIRSYKGQEVHVTGGRRVPSSALHTVTDHTIVNALPQAARHSVKVINLSDLGITTDGSLRNYGAYRSRTAPFEMFFNGQPLRLARWPNEGFINIASTPDGMNGSRFGYNSNRPAGWSHQDDLYIYGYLYWSWADEALGVASLDTHNMMVTLNSTKTNFGLRKGHWGGSKLAGFRDQGGYFRFINVLSELDVPGEYYIDQKTRKLYVWLPHAGSSHTSDVVYVSVIETCFNLGSAENVVFSDFVIEACRQRAIQGYNVKNIRVTNMEIRNTGDFNVMLGGNSKNCYISKSIFHDGDGAVNIQGGSRKTLQSSGHVVEDCVMYRFSREGSVGRNAVKMGGGNDHVIEYNHVHDVCMNASDCGAIHTGRDWTYHGNQIRYNIVHNTTRRVPGADVRGVMLDDQVSGQIITNNVFYNNEIHVNIGGGRDNIINNNLMYNSTKASMQVDGRGLHRDDYAAYIVRKLHAMPYKGQLWAARYPVLAKIDNHNASLPEGNQIHRNLVFNTAHKPFITGMTGWLNSPVYFNVTDTGFSYGPGDHYDVDADDLRIKCHAAEWANYVNFQQVITLNDVGPRYTVGPSFNNIAHQRVHLSNSPKPCTTHAPATTAPMSSFLPDGSGTQTPIFQASNQGCWFHVAVCTNDHNAAGTYRDTYGETHVNAGTNETACVQRAAAQWKYCGSVHDEPVVAIYGPTGSTTFAGDGCFMAMYGCPKHGGPANGHVVAGKIYRDTYAEQQHNAAHNEANCLSRALVQWRWCGSSPNHPVTSIYRPTGHFVTAGAGCWIKLTQCPKQPNLPPMFYDAVGATNSNTDDSEGACFIRAEDYWRLCAADSRHPVTAYYRPSASSTTYPPAA